MARNPNKKKCAVEGCRAWAMRGRELCASHSRQVEVGAPAGNRNAVKHGFYDSRRLLSGGEGSRPGRVVAEVLRVPTLDDEIALLAARRDAVDRWMLGRMEAGEEVDVLRYLALLGQIGSRIARMMKVREALGENGDVISELFDEVLDLVNGQVVVDV